MKNHSIIQTKNCSERIGTWFCIFVASLIEGSWVLMSASAFTLLRNIVQLNPIKIQPHTDMWLLC
jgi:hypothetical protein